jgi:hypothetical protein
MVNLKRRRLWSTIIVSTGGVVPKRIARQSPGVTNPGEFCWTQGDADVLVVVDVDLSSHPSVTARSRIDVSALH